MRLVILDRDGVINAESDAFIRAPREWVPIPGSLEAIAQLHQRGYRVVVATNQSGIARGLFDTETLQRIHSKMTDAVIAAGGRLAGLYVCPHGPWQGCRCRKPRPGLLEAIARDLDTSLAETPAIGDSRRDLDAAAAVGARPILVRTGKGRETERELGLTYGPTIAVFDDLAAAANHLID